jgi:hypothetical protein
MGFFDCLFGRKSPQQAAMNTPFMEHPTGEFKSAVEAIADAIKRLRALPEWNNWITFCAQGRGHDEDSDYHAEIRMRRDELELDEPIDPASVIQRAGASPSSLIAVGDNYSIANASPTEAARVMDAIFRHCLGIRPHADQGDDYAIGAEW